jgi:hypothetical protein
MKQGLPIVWLFASVFLWAGCGIVNISPPLDEQGTSAAATFSAQPPGSPTPTLPPSATAVITPSSTPAPSPTIAPSASPTNTELPPDDPRRGLELSAPHHIDTFDIRFRWGEPHSKTATIYLEDGRLHAVDHQPDPYVAWSRNDLTAGNFYAEVSAEVGPCEGRDGYGLAVRINGQEANNAYSLEFSCSGEYRVRVFRGGGVETLIDWSPSDSIKKGPTEKNRMGFLAKGSDLYAFANGMPLGQTRSTLFYSGTFGLFASAAQSNDVSVDFDDFAVWFLGP